MLNWIRNLFLTNQRALKELDRRWPNRDWRVETTEAGTTKIYANGSLMTHTESLSKCMNRIRKYLS